MEIGNRLMSMKTTPFVEINESTSQFSIKEQVNDACDEIIKWHITSYLELEKIQRHADFPFNQHCTLSRTLTRRITMKLFSFASIALYETTLSIILLSILIPLAGYRSAELWPRNGAIHQELSHGEASGTSASTPLTHLVTSGNGSTMVMAGLDQVTSALARELGPLSPLCMMRLM